MKLIEIPELTEFQGSLKDLQKIVNELVSKYGENTDINFNVKETDYQIYGSYAYVVVK